MAVSSTARRVPIAQLAPDLQSIEEAYVQGVVTLVWPYSSSIKSLSLLLVEPDFRLRRQQGQVRISFHRSGALALAEHHVSSGDQLLLGLKGSSWSRPTTSTVSTPGRGIDWDLQYEDLVDVSIQRPGENTKSIVVDHPLAPPDLPSSPPSPLAHPRYDRSFRIADANLHAQSESKNNVWSSPAFLRRRRLFHSSHDSFLEDLEDFPENNRQKKLKFGQAVNEWRFADRTPSPQKDEHVSPEGQGSRSSSPSASAQDQALEQPVPKDGGPQTTSNATYAPDSETDKDTQMYEKQPLVSIVEDLKFPEDDQSPSNDASKTSSKPVLDTKRPPEEPENPPGPLSPAVTGPFSDDEPLSAASRESKQLPVASSSPVSARSSSPVTDKVPKDARPSQDHRMPDLGLDGTFVSRISQTYQESSSDRFVEALDELCGESQDLHVLNKATLAVDNGTNEEENAQRTRSPVYTVDEICTTQSDLIETSERLQEDSSHRGGNNILPDASEIQSNDMGAADGFLSNAKLRIPEPNSVMPVSVQAVTQDIESAHPGHEFKDLTFLAGSEQTKLPVPYEVETVYSSSPNQREVVDVKGDDKEENAQLQLDSFRPVVPDSLHTSFGLEDVPESLVGSQDSARDLSHSDESAVIVGDDPDEEAVTVVQNHEDEARTVKELPPTRLLQHVMVEDAEPDKPGQLYDEINSQEPKVDPEQEVVCLDNTPTFTRALTSTEGNILVVDDRVEILHQDIEQASNVTSQPLTILSDSFDDDHDSIVPRLTQDTSAGLTIPELPPVPDILPSTHGQASSSEAERDPTEKASLLTAEFSFAQAGYATSQDHENLKKEGNEVELTQDALVVKASQAQFSEEVDPKKIEQDLQPNIELPQVTADPVILEDESYSDAGLTYGLPQGQLQMDAPAEIANQSKIRDEKEAVKNETITQIEGKTSFVEANQNASEDHIVSKEMRIDMELHANSSTASADKKIEDPDVQPKRAAAAEADEGDGQGQNISRGREARKENGSRTVVRETSLVRRLKEQRRRSRLQQQEQHISPSTASPWFEPQGSKSSTPDQVHRYQKPTPSLPKLSRPAISLPRSSERRLSNSFIRSSPVPSPSPQSGSLTKSSPTSHQPTTGFRTSLSYFVPLASLHRHYDTIVDVLAVVVATNPIIKAVSGPKDFVLSLHLVDPSAVITDNPAGVTIITAQCFRPQKISLPRARQGDAILLRNFKVHSLQKHLALLSTEASAWAIFRKDTDVQIRGPPLEFGPEERGFARAHWNWWDSLKEGDRVSLGDAASIKIRLANKSSQQGSTTQRKKGIGFELPTVSSTKRTSPKKRAISEPANSISRTSNDMADEASNDSDGFEDSQEREAEAEADVSDAPSPLRRSLRNRRKDVSTPLPSPTLSKKEKKSPAKPSPDKPTVHDLRDGTQYVDSRDLGADAADTQIELHRLRDGRTYRDRR